MARQLRRNSRSAGIIESGQSANRDASEVAVPHESIEQRQNVGSGRVDQRPQGQPASFGIGLGVTDDRLQLVGCTAVAEDDRQIAHARLHLFRGVALQHCGDLRPVLWRLGLSPAAKSIPHPRKHVETKRRVVACGESGRQQVGPLRLAIKFGGQTPGQVLAHDRHRRLREQRDRLLDVATRLGFDPVPDHQRQDRVVRELTPRRERFADRPTIG